MMRYYGDSWGGMMGGWVGGGYALVCWITLFLLWTLMVLLIIALVRHLIKENKHGCCDGHKGNRHDGNGA